MIRHVGKNIVFGNRDRSILNILWMGKRDVLDDLYLFQEDGAG
jgi:hypothetical protein